MRVFRLGRENPSICILLEFFGWGWHQQGHGLRLGDCASEVMAFDSGIQGMGSQHVVSFDWASKQQVVPFDWGLALVRECLSSEPGLSASVPLAGPFCLVVFFDWASEISVSVPLDGPGSQCGS